MADSEIDEIVKDEDDKVVSDDDIVVLEESCVYFIEIFSNTFTLPFVPVMPSVKKKTRRR